MKPTPYDLRVKAHKLWNEHHQLAATLVNWSKSDSRKKLLRKTKTLAAKLDPQSINIDMQHAVMYIDSIMTRENVHYPMIGEK